MVVTGSTSTDDRRTGGDRAAGDGDGCAASLVSAPLSEAEAVALARVLAALADPVRLGLLSDVWVVMGLGRVALGRGHLG